MGKKDRKKQRERARAAEPETVRYPAFSRRGWRLLFTGIGVCASGYVILSFTDPGGKNWASRVSPFVILAGYALMGAGIVAKDPTETPL